jgi:hypothetical protein
LTSTRDKRVIKKKPVFKSPIFIPMKMVEASFKHGITEGAAGWYSR